MKQRNQAAIHGIFVVFLAAALAWMIVYLITCSADVPFMDYYQKSEFIEHAMEGELSLSDFWRTKSVHKNPVSGLLLYINLQLFHWNTLISVYFGMIISALTVVFLYVSLCKMARSRDRFSLPIAGGLLALIVLQFGDWEIITNEFSCTFTLRVFIFALLMYASDRFIMGKAKRLLSAILLGCFIGVSFVLIGQMYFFGVFIAVLVASLFHFLSDAQDRKARYGLLYAVIICCMLVGLFTYFYGVDFASEGGFANAPVPSSPVSSLIAMVFDGTFIRSVCIAFASAIYQMESVTNSTYTLGGACFAFTLLSIVLFFWKKLHKKTLFPLMLILYGAVNIVMFMYSRIPRFGLPGMAASRYVIDTKLIFVGLIYIWWLLWNKRTKKSVWAFSLAPVFVIFLVTITIISNLNQWEIAPYRRAAFLNTRSSILLADQMDDSDLNINQAHTVETFRNTVRVMKRYSLGVFRNSNTQIGSTRETALIAGQYWSDHWMGDHVYICISSGEEGSIHMDLYNPRSNNVGKTFSIFYGENEYTFAVQEGLFDVDLAVVPKSLVTLKVDLGMIAEQVGSDSRTLSLVLSELAAY